MRDITPKLDTQVTVRSMFAVHYKRHQQSIKRRTRIFDSILCMTQTKASVSEFQHCNNFNIKNLNITNNQRH